MIFDPFSVVIESTGISIVFFAIGWAFASMAVDVFGILQLKDEKYSLTRYYTENFWETWAWPVLVLIPSMALYFGLSKIPAWFQTELLQHGFTYNQFAISGISSPLLFILIVLLSAWINILVGRNIIHARPKFWSMDPAVLQLSHWKIERPLVWLRIWLIGFPMTVALLLALARFIDVWTVLLKFLNSDWVPVDFIGLDKMYGASWAYQYFYWIHSVLLFALLSVAGVFSISRFNKSQKSHIAAFTLIFVVALSFQLTVSAAFDKFLGRIHDHFLFNLSNVSQVNIGSVEQDGLMSLAEATYRLNILGEYSSKFEMPAMLSWAGDVAFVASLIAGLIGIYEYRASKNKELPKLKTVFKAIMSPTNGRVKKKSRKQ